jgi:translation initiation factor 2 subunit 1
VVEIRRYEEWPEVGELVMVTIKEIYPNSALVVLDEYPGKKGMIHISEISTRWIRNIRDFVKEGQRWVAKVLSVEPETKHITLSIKRVSPSAKREKQKQWNNEVKAEKWLQMIAKEIGKDPSRIYEDIGFLLQRKFDLMYSAFEIAHKEGKDALIKEGIPKEWAEGIEKIAKQYIREKEVEITRFLEIRCLHGKGVEFIKQAVSRNIPKNGIVKYISSPRYYISVKGKDYKECEKHIADFVSKVNDELSKNKGYCRVAEVQE